MATVATAMYQHSFLPQSNRVTSSTSSGFQAQPSQQQDQEILYTLFCRALYDYDAQDASALSFKRGDIIEVLTQQPSGWWDGLLGDERGWFPSNYVTIISDEEAELAFSGSDFSNGDSQGMESHTDPAILDMSQVMTTNSTLAENEEWLDNELSYRNGWTGHNVPTSGNPSQPSDFWMPEVTPNGQIYYVNTHTGQRSRDLPQEAEDEVSDGDLAGLTAQISSRTGTHAGLAFAAKGFSEPTLHDVEVAGFGVQRRTGTPEPWERKLADDGMSYYYHNKVDGRVQWTRPEGRGRNISESSQTGAFTPKIDADHQDKVESSRLSVYSDDSDIQPFLEHTNTLSSDPAINRNRPRPPGPEHHPSTILELISAEKIAKSLQQTLTPAPPEMLTDLSAIVRGSIQAVIKNVQAGGVSREFTDDAEMDKLIYAVVFAVRNLLYISTSNNTHLQTGSSKEARDGKGSSASPLKPAQRKVTATLSRLVLSARAMQYDSGSHLSETLSRIEADADELEKAVLSFVLEVQRLHHTSSSGSVQGKRLMGVYSTVNIGLGLAGSGTAGSWKGFGWVPLDDEEEMPRKVLGTEVVSEMSASISRIEESFASLNTAVRIGGEISEKVFPHVEAVMMRSSLFTNLVEDIHIARRVDIDGIHQTNDGVIDDHYSQSVQNARHHVRMLETTLQGVYDDCAALLLTTQSLMGKSTRRLLDEEEPTHGILQLTASLRSNLNLTQQTIEALLAIGHDQADTAQGEYSGSIDRRISRLSMINNPFGDSVRLSRYSEDPPVIRKGDKPLQDPSSDPYKTLSSNDHSDDKTLVSPSTIDATHDGDADTFVDDPILGKAGTPARPAGRSKLEKVLGKEYTYKVAADVQPWYLRPNYNPTEIIIDPDNTIRGGTVPSLVERLTAHEQADHTFNRAFLMTYKSFTTLDELFDLLVERFRIQPPANLTPEEREDWGKLKQHVIQMRVINTFKSMVVDEDVLDKEDMHILDRMKDFLTSEEVSRFAVAKSILVLIERAKSADSALRLINTNQVAPPPPIMPKTSKKLKLLDIEPLELARQLTIMESQLYQKIKPMECLQRSREQKTDSIDNIAVVIQTSNRIADWVAESILSKEDSKKRAQAVKHLISVADRCRTLNNFSSMIAITSGLNTPPIRRLKRTWEQVSQRYMAQFGACEMTIDSNKNFEKYRKLMANVTPPCVPFIGVFLSTLQFIQDGNPDNLPGGLVNFWKRQKACEVINDIKRWQALPFNLTPVQPIIAYIEESLNQFNDTKASSEHFWTLSLEREPREREDEKMARLLQESGFL